MRWKIEGYDFGRIAVDGKSYTSDVIVSSEGILKSSWWRNESHRIAREDVADILDFNPEIVVFGLGYHGRVRVEREVESLLREKGIEVEKLRSREAVERFNDLLEKKKRVVLAIHLTC
jgi:hypothetical protein